MVTFAGPTADPASAPAAADSWTLPAPRVVLDATAEPDLVPTYLNAVTAIATAHPRTDPTESQSRADLFCERYLWPLEESPGIDGNGSQMLALQHPGFAHLGDVLAVALTDGTAYVLDFGQRRWRHCTEHCATCEQLIVHRYDPSRSTIPVVASPACSMECATRWVSRTSRDAISRILNDGWRIVRCQHHGAVPEYVQPGGGDKYLDYSPIFSVRGVDVPETERRQQAYGPDIGVFVLVDGVEFSVRRTDLRWRIQVPAAWRRPREVAA